MAAVTAAKKIPAETLSMSELDRQAEEANRIFAIAAARREAAASLAHHERVDDRRGARVTAPELAAICGAVSSQTLRGWKADPIDWNDLRSMLMAEAIGKCAETPIRREVAPIERAHLSLAERWWHAPAGTPSADRRIRLMEAEMARVDAGTEAMPRIGNLADDDVNLSWLHQRARAICLKARRGGVTGDDHGTVGVTATDPASMPRKIASLPRWDAGLSAADVATIIGETTKDERAALAVAIDGTALADLAAEMGWTYGTAKVAVKRGRASLRDDRAQILDALDADRASGRTDLEPCPTCNGSRVHLDKSGEESDCRACHGKGEVPNAQTLAWRRIVAAIAQQRAGKPAERTGVPCTRWPLIRAAYGHKIRIAHRSHLMAIAARQNASKAPRPTVLATAHAWTTLGLPIGQTVTALDRKRIGKPAKVTTGAWQTVPNPDAAAMLAYRRKVNERHSGVTLSRRLTGRI